MEISPYLRVYLSEMPVRPSLVQAYLMLKNRPSTLENKEGKESQL